MTNCRHQYRRIMTDWSALPDDVVARIVERYLVSVEDFVSVSSVCRSWNRASTFCNRIKLEQAWSRQLPWLMLTDGNDELVSFDSNSDGNSDDELIYYTPSELENLEEVDSNVITINEEYQSTIYTRIILSGKKQYSLNWFKGYGRVCWGSAHGWIATTGLDHHMSLYNPLSKCRLDLPSRRTLPFLWKHNPKNLRQFFIKRIVVLKVPSDIHNNGKETLHVVLIYDAFERVAIAKPGDTKWKLIDWACGKQPNIFLCDVSYCQSLDLLLFVCRYGSLAYCNLRTNDQCLVLHEYCPRLEGLSYGLEEGVRNWIYVATSLEGVFLVVRSKEVIYDEHDYYVKSCKTLGFKVYKLNFDKNNWGELQCFPDVALFVGDNSTMLVYASQAGCPSNCIYFTDDLYRGGCGGVRNELAGYDMGVFKMDDKSMSFILEKEKNNTRSAYCCPLWFQPAL